MTAHPPGLESYACALSKGRYRHYKGKDYIVYGSVTHSETEEILVLYAPENQMTGVARLWVRPLSMFLESVQTDGGLVPRFAPVD